MGKVGLGLEERLAGERVSAGLFPGADAGEFGLAVWGSGLGSGVPAIEVGVVPQAFRMIRRIPAGVKDILVDPADAGGIRAELGFDPLGEAVAGEVEVFEHTGASPVDISSVFEENVDEGLLEHAVTADDLGAGYRK